MAGSVRAEVPRCVWSKRTQQLAGFPSRSTDPAFLKRRLFGQLRFGG